MVRYHAMRCRSIRPRVVWWHRFIVKMTIKAVDSSFRDNHIVKMIVTDEYDAYGNNNLEFTRKFEECKGRHDAQYPTP